MKKLVVLNHKMAMLYDDVYPYINTLNNINTDNDIIVFPSSIYLEAFINNCDYPIGVQNMHYASSYEYTGEISLEQLKSIGAYYAIVGHYERVSNFNENPNIVNEKLIAALDSNMIPILCFGEDIDEDYKEKLPKLLDKYLKNIDNIEFIIFAYEPIYAIGTCSLPSVDKIEKVINYVSDYLNNKYHKKPTLLYGGSVDYSNVHDIVNINNISGVMIGSNSSNIKEVEKIINNI